MALTKQEKRVLYGAGAVAVALLLFFLIRKKEPTPTIAGVYVEVR